jgi:hypothetical protein
MKFDFVLRFRCTHENVYMPGVARVAASSLWKEKPDFNFGRLFAVAAVHPLNVRLPVEADGVGLLL